MHSSNPAGCRKALGLWIRALRVFSFPASAVPVVVGAGYVFGRREPADWWLLPFALVGAVAFHAGANLVSEYFDFRKGIDRPGTFGSSGILVGRLMRPRQILVGGIVAYLVGLALGLPIVAVQGWPILLFAAVGLVGGWLYTATKYAALSDLAIFFLMGPLMVVGAVFALTGRFDGNAVVVSLPVGCLVAAILYANNVRDLGDDRAVGVRTLAVFLGHGAAKWGYPILVSAAYVLTAVMAAVGVWPRWALVVFVTVPMAVGPIVKIARSRPDQPAALVGLDVRTAQLHLLFGLVFAASFVVGRLVS